MDDEARPDDDPAPPTRRSRVGTAMLVLAGLLVIAAAVFIAVALQADSAASDDRHATTRAQAREHTLEAQHQNFVRTANDLVTDVATARGYLFGARDAASGWGKAQTNFSDTYNRGAMLHNQGDAAGGSAVFTGDVTSAGADMDQKIAALQQEIEQADAAIRKVAASTR